LAEDGSASGDHAHLDPGVREGEAQPDAAREWVAHKRNFGRVYSRETGYGQGATGAGQTSEGAKVIRPRIAKIRGPCGFTCRWCDALAQL
jgi:hypothetical protein